LLRRVPDPEEATRVDAALRLVARREASERLALGRLAMLFRVRQGHHDLGFSSVGDYTRERLGISQSQFYDLAQVATALASLPLIHDALVRGDISWTKARELAVVAAPDTQEQWLELASQSTADRLRELVAACRAKARPHRPSEGPSNASSSCSGDKARRAAARMTRRSTASRR
jgi:hypothetical protein